ncbi:MAG: UbiH/UbiF family hydroxylase [Nitratireductor sp.]
MSDNTIAIAGSGLAGLTAALAMARLESGPTTSVVVIAPKPQFEDRRTTAMLAGSVAFLDELGVWKKVADKAAGLSTMRIIDATNRLIRAPQVDFRSSEIGLPAFGYNISNAVMTKALAETCIATGKVRFIEASVSSAALQPDRATLTLDSGDMLDCGLVIGADGRHSKIRQSAGIGVREWTYPQTAIVCDFEHSLDHNNTSTEFHTPTGPFTLVPLGRGKSSLVWVEKPEFAKAIAATPVETLNRMIEDRMQSLLGKVTITSAIQTWPLSGMTATRFGQGPLALIGEAAHVVPPIGAQGFNLGIRDIELLVELSRQTPANLTTIGDLFHRRRTADIAMRTASIDIFNRSLLSDFLPVQIVRSLGLYTLGTISPLRRMMMREGVSPGAAFDHLSQKLRENLPNGGSGTQPARKAAR